MNISEFHEATRRQPFRGLVIRMADGEEVRVEHPENLAYDLATRTAACHGPSGWLVIDVDLITSLVLPLPQRAGASPEED